MRQRVALMWMALGIMTAGSAWAHDATQVVYDLSTLRTPQVAVPAPHANRDMAMPATPAPMSMPSLQRNGNNDLPLDDGNMEVRNRNHNPHPGVGAGSPREGQGGGPTNNPSPTPEPGTLLLLGGALASGARFFRRR
jgi:hypothetical protein